MQKFMTRYGIRLLCGRLPPAGLSEVTCMAELLPLLPHAALPVDLASAVAGVGDDTSPGVLVARMAWVCTGISDCSSVTNSAPPSSPTVREDSPCPWPQCIGDRPCMSGSANVDLPSPPCMVPSSENSAVFCVIGRSWPLQCAHPVGGKLKPKIRISPTNGSD